MAPLDASKAFDTVNHYKLFSCLLKVDLPLFLVKLLINWYSRLSVFNCWNGHFSSAFKVENGVRQGGILSPFLFYLYVNSIILNVRKDDLGCHVRNVCVGCILYAEDIILLSFSINDLQKILDNCYRTAEDLDVFFNCLKCKCIVFGAQRTIAHDNLTSNGSPLQWVDYLKYLGVMLVPGFSFQLT